MSFQKNHIIDNHTLRTTKFDVHGFLTSLQSPLLKAQPGVGKLIEKQAAGWGVNPILFLIKLQVEQSLLTKVPPDHSHYDWALGIGRPDRGSAIEKYRGFEKQIEGFGHLFCSYQDPKSPLYAGNFVGKDHSVLDGTVHCWNLATACLYRYTPYQGDKDFGELKAPFGQYLLYLVAKRWFPGFVVEG
jgi:hypothetical protein